VKALKDYIAKSDARRFFVRGGVGIGKTTLIQHGLQQDPEFHVGQHNDTRQNLESASKGKRYIVFDEAHLVLANSDLTSAFKDHFSDKIVVFFSASSRTQTASKEEVTLTPGSEWHRVFWTPPPPDVKLLAAQLNLAKLPMTEEAIRTMCAYCSNHRNILICLLAGLRSKKGCEKIDTPQVVEYLQSKEAVEAAWESRAVKANGNFDDLTAIPEEFLRTLFSGEYQFSDQADERRCMIGGLILPARVVAKDEFSSFAWSKLVRVAHPMMAWHYFDRYNDDFGVRRELKPGLKLSSCFDVMLLVVPMLAPHTVIPQKVKGFVGAISKSTGLPYEVQFTSRMVQIATELSLQAASYESPGHGKIDFVLTFGEETYGIEAIMYNDDTKAHHVKEHIDRFADLPNYKAPTHKALLLIRSDTKSLADWVHRVAQSTDVPVLDLAADKSLRTFTLAELNGTQPRKIFALEADGVPRRIKVDGTLEAATTYKVPLTLVRNKSVWVKYGTAVFEVTPAKNNVDSLKEAVKSKAQLLQPAFTLIVKDPEGNTLNDVSTALKANTEGSPYTVLEPEEAKTVEVPSPIWVKYGTAVFEVTPAKNNVDSLKEAVKAKWDSSNPGHVLNMFQLTVKDHKGNMLEVDAALEANTKVTSYIVE
jgi:hypothetical protein